MSHRIKLEDLQAWIEGDVLVLFASASPEQKKLFANLAGGYEVHHKGKKVWAGISSFEAVEKYNSI